jgi:tRNA U34 5-carboxymethylaminomethyl modifying GTPase MnmE/TrmE
MKNSILTPEEKKARKAAYDKAYRERKKAAEALVQEPKETIPEVVAVVEFPEPKGKTKKEKIVVDKIKKEKNIITKIITSPVRLFHSLKMVKEKSYCAKVGRELNFEQIDEKIFRVKKGKRIYYATADEVKGLA